MVELCRALEVPPHFMLEMIEEPRKPKRKSKTKKKKSQV